MTNEAALGILAAKMTRMNKWGEDPNWKYRYLCPIGHDDPERKHFHRDHRKGMFQHNEAINGAIMHMTFVVEKHSQMIPNYEGPDKKYYRLISILLTAFGTGPDTNYHKKKVTKRIGHMVKNTMRDARMIRDA